ncbi:MAG: hypothetical protein WCA89_04950 [Terracidiphilus sp.]|jgi:hypothetical protein
MSRKKRGKTGHCYFVVSTQRFRQSLATTNWREAQAKEKESIGQASEGKQTQNSTSPSGDPIRREAGFAIMAIAGHFSRKMLKRYSYVRMEAKRAAMETLASSARMADYDTNHETSALPLNARLV